jgi:hypothetical protein
MKKLILILLFIPLFCSSQVIISNVHKMCISEDSEKTDSCSNVYSNMSIYVEDGFLVIKNDVEISKYEIDYTYSNNEKGDLVFAFDILIDNEIFFASKSQNDYGQIFVMRDEKRKKVAKFFEYNKKNLN